MDHAILQTIIRFILCQVFANIPIILLLFPVALYLMKLLAAKCVYIIINHFLFEGLNDRYAVIVCIYRIHQYIRRIMAAIDTII